MVKTNRSTLHTVYNMYHAHRGMARLSWPGWLIEPKKLPPIPVYLCTGIPIIYNFILNSVYACIRFLNATIRCWPF